MKSTSSLDERAVRDALERFIAYRLLSELAIEPHQHFSKTPVTVGGAAVTMMTRQQLAEQHRGDKVAPLITTINVYRPTRKPAPDLCVGIARGAAATTGFEVRPYGMMITYCYVEKGGSLELTSEDVEVE